MRVESDNLNIYLVRGQGVYKGGGGGATLHAITRTLLKRVADLGTPLCRFKFS